MDLFPQHTISEISCTFCNSVAASTSGCANVNDEVLRMCCKTNALNTESRDCRGGEKV